MSDGMGRELAYLSSHATNRYFIQNWGIFIILMFSYLLRRYSFLFYRGKVAISKPPSAFLYENLFIYKVFKQMLTDFRRH